MCNQSDPSTFGLTYIVVDIQVIRQGVSSVRVGLSGRVEEGNSGVRHFSMMLARAEIGLIGVEKRKVIGGRFLPLPGECR